MTEEAEEPKQPRKKRHMIVRLVRLAALAAAGVWIAKKVKSRPSAPEGLWREGISGDGKATADRR